MDVAQFAPEIITAAVAALAALAVQRKVISKTRLEETLVYAEWAVKAAEEAYKHLPKAGGDKLAYALKAVTAKTGVSNDEATVLIHAAVQGLRNAGYLGSTTAE